MAAENPAFDNIIAQFGESDFDFGGEQTDPFLERNQELADEIIEANSKYQKKAIARAAEAEAKNLKSPEGTEIFIRNEMLNQLSISLELMTTFEQTRYMTVEECSGRTGEFVGTILPYLHVGEQLFRVSARQIETAPIFKNNAELTPEDGDPIECVLIGVTAPQQVEAEPFHAKFVSPHVSVTGNERIGYSPRFSLLFSNEDTKDVDDRSLADSDFPVVRITTEYFTKIPIDGELEVTDPRLEYLEKYREKHHQLETLLDEMYVDEHGEIVDPDGPDLLNRLDLIREVVEPLKPNPRATELDIDVITELQSINERLKIHPEEATLTAELLEMLFRGFVRVDGNVYQFREGKMNFEGLSEQLASADVKVIAPFAFAGDGSLYFGFDDGETTRYIPFAEAARIEV